MRSPNTLTRQQFNDAANKFITLQEDLNRNELSQMITRGWRWQEHSSYPNLGFMQRSTTAFETEGPLDDTQDLDYENGFEEEIDDKSQAAHITPSKTCLFVQQYVVWSPSFQVPAFYFAIHDPNGTPLPLARIIRTTLFRKMVPMIDNSSYDTSQFALFAPTSDAENAPAQFPLLSQGDHPTLGIPCWYFHPCETPTTVSEILSEVIGDAWEEDSANGLLRWLETWFMVLGSVIDLQVGEV